MKKFLVMTLSLVLAVCLTVPTGAIAPGETIYVYCTEEAVTSITADFTLSGDQHQRISVSSEETDEAGMYRFQIPDGATRVTFEVQPFPLPDITSLPGVGESFTLSELTGNTYDIVTGQWSGADGSEEEETTADTSEDTSEDPSPNNPTPPSEGGSYTDEDGQNTATINISGSVGQNSSPTEVVSVDIVWEAMSFTYTPPADATWDPNTHTYTGGTTDGEWSSSANSITITNHSNVAIQAALSFQSVESLSIEGEFKNSANETIDAINLGSADNGTATAPTETVSFHITSGAISSDTPTLGTVTVTISKQD